MKHRGLHGFLTACLLSVLLTGCNQQSQMPATHNIDLFGGRYFLEIETVGSFSFSSRVENRASGTETVVQLAEYEWGGNKLKIDMGTLTFNGKECGTLEPGDHVRVDKNGLLTVNGKQRP